MSPCDMLPLRAEHSGLHVSLKFAPPTLSILNNPYCRSLPKWGCASIEHDHTNVVNEMIMQSLIHLAFAIDLADSSILAVNCL